MTGLAGGLAATTCNLRLIPSGDFLHILCATNFRQPLSGFSQLRPLHLVLLAGGWVVSVAVLPPRAVCTDSRHHHDDKFIGQSSELQRLRKSSDHRQFLVLIGHEGLANSLDGEGRCPRQIGTLDGLKINKNCFLIKKYCFLFLKTYIFLAS